MKIREIFGSPIFEFVIPDSGIQMFVEQNKQRNKRTKRLKQKKEKDGDE